MRTRFSEGIARAVAGALALLVPVACAGCGEQGASLCDRCRSQLRVRVRRVEIDGADLDVYAAFAYAGVPAGVIRGLKQQGRLRLAAALAPGLRAALSAAAGPRTQVHAVAVPQGRRSSRKRGYRVVDLLLRRAGLAPLPALRWRRQIADQRGLNREQRRRNLAGALTARIRRGTRVVIVDDVVTTGATLLEAQRALESAGAIVVGAATVAATPKRLG